MGTSECHNYKTYYLPALLLQYDNLVILACLLFEVLSFLDDGGSLLTRSEQLLTQSSSSVWALTQFVDELFFVLNFYFRGQLFLSAPQYDKA